MLNFFIGAIVGATLGVIIMALFIANKDRR
jgi:hypothetical protein